MSNVIGPESVPPTLVEREQWICWRYEQGGDKKPPYDPETDDRASTQNPETWTDFGTAIETYRAADYDGIGIILTEDGSITGFDFDDCRDPETGEIDYRDEAIIDCLESYSEVSPSGTGLHTLVIGEKPHDVGSRSGDGIEVYDSGQYFTFTGNHLDSTPETIEERSTEIRAVCEAYLTTERPEGGESIGELPDGDQDEDAIKQAQGYIRNFMHGQETGSRARDYYSDLLKCRYSKRGFGDDRSAAETALCTLTYGILLDGGADPDEARSLTYQYITHVARENPRTDNGNEIRKWLEGPSRQRRNYRQNTLDYAIRNFDPELWNLWRLSGRNKTTNDYSEHAYKIVLDVLHDLTVESDLLSPPTLSTNNNPPSSGYSPLSRGYPTMGEIVERAQEEYELTDDSYREILRRIRRDGDAKMARLGSSTHVYYPANCPDPPDACYVRDKDGKREPESEPESVVSGEESTVSAER